MKTPDALLAMAAVLAAGCSRTTADRAPPQPPQPPQHQYSGATDPYPATPPVQAAPPQRPPPVTAPAAADDDDELPPTFSGIALDPTFSSACQLPPSPSAFFEFDSADLDSRDVAVLRRVAACLTDGPLRGHPIELVGRTDPRGAADYNESLARARVEAVRSFLLDEGVPADNIAVRVAAEAMADPLWPPGWGYDRRVDIRLGP